MNGESSGKVPELGLKEDCMSMLRGLDREEILKVLSKGFCRHCQPDFESRLQAVHNRKLMKEISTSDASSAEASPEILPTDSSRSYSQQNGSESSTRSTSWGPNQTPGSIYLARSKGYAPVSSPASVKSKQSPINNNLGSDILLNDGLSRVPSVVDNGLLEEQKENVRFAQVGRKKNFVHMERINGRQTNVLQGIELHTQVFNVEEQKKIVECVYNLQRMGQKGQLRERTYSEPAKWMRGKGRVTIQFGCCYNYAVDKDGNPPGILRDEEVDPLPQLFKKMIKRMVRWHVLPLTCIPNSCIVNIYDEGDCIPPHIDHHDFLRPFCTVSFLAECNILFGANLKIVGPGEFAGPFSLPLPVGSVLILNGNGADVAKHCVPGVPARRISITFRRMDESKIPYKFSPDSELQGIRPLVYTPLLKSPFQQNQHENRKAIPQIVADTTSDPSFLIEKEEFPPLGNLGSGRHRGNKNNGLRA